MYPLSPQFLPKFPRSISHIPTLKKQKNTSPILDTQNQIKNNIKKQSLLAIIFKSLDDFVTNFIDSPLTPSTDPNHVLAGNFAPVAELPPTAAEVVEGSLPRCLDGGAYIRNGPNPQFLPRGPHHLFDGDGMLHSVRISGGGAELCSRYVKTYKLTTEGDMGYPFFISPFSSFNGRASSAARVFLAAARVFTGCFNPFAHGLGTANTSLALIGGRLHALCESDLPYEIAITPAGDIVTLGRRRDFGGGGAAARMTAHPHADPETGEVFTFRCSVFPPFLTFFRVDSGGRKCGGDLPFFSMKKLPWVHDFAVTERFIVFEDGQLEMDLMEMVRGRVPLVFDRRKVPRIGVLPRGAAAEEEVTWIEAAGVNMLHVINAWEEDSGGKIVILAPNILSLDFITNTNLIHCEFEMITLDVNGGKVVSRKKLCDKNMEFGVINPAYSGKKNKYVYASLISEMPKAEGVVKLDLSIATGGGGDCTVARRMYEAGVYGGETCFVARDGENPSAEEDDGYLITYVHDENTMESWFWVMNAKSPTLEIVARVRLPGSPLWIPWNICTTR